ncbi:putative glucose-methanol-choline oxidoreductase [Xylaria cf. heliscus]|nr:putative glucose-methanol-choline oxidoreductase [Xylaria cf. heliscus]
MRSLSQLTAVVYIAGSVCGKAIPPNLDPPRLLGSSFGIPGDDATYDYVVVGGGTAGLTLATRLVEQQAGSVAVIEAGTFYEIVGNTSQVPAYDSYFSSKGANDWHPLVDWGYQTTPQAGGYNESIHYARGKMLGGSSGRNYMAYQRGSAGSYKMWADAVGDSSYEFPSFLPYFMKSVNFTGPSDSRFANSTPSFDPATVGVKDGTGPLSVTFSHYAQAFATWATKGLQQIGLPIIDGFQSGNLLGQSYCMFTINADTMVRESSETSFLRRGLSNPELLVYQLTQAKRIIFDGKTAKGVVVDTQGLEYTLSARKEVILSAGVFGSPQLLMVSGVGPEQTLKQLGIPIVADRPGVGQGMQDHIYFGITYRVNAPTLSALQDPAFAAEQAILYNTKAIGMYTNPTTDVLGWEKIPRRLRRTLSNHTLEAFKDYPADWPEVEYLSLSGYVGLQEDSRFGAPTDGANYATLAISTVAPRSRGYVSIRSNDTSDAPIINPNFLTDRADVEVSIAAFKRARQFWRTNAMRQFTIGDEAFPGKNITTDAQIENIIRRSYNTIYHGACTCAMGKEDDPMAVLDSKARVYGVEGLRVVDAASFPILIPGHPQATVYALAEKIACDISGKC